MPLNPRLPEAAKLLMRLGGPVTKDLVHWLDETRNHHEEIHAYEWTNDWWYVEIFSHRAGSCAITRTLLGFTVHITHDEIMWANHTAFNPSGGNCFCRSTRWVRQLRTKFPGITFTRTTIPGTPAEGQVYDYRPRRCATHSKT